MDTMNDISILEEAQILAWLQQHPDFFANHPELLPSAIQASGKILSLEAGQLNHLRRQNDQLREKLDIILERIRRNEEIYRDFHAIQIKLIMASTPWAMIAVATQEVENLFNIQRVTVSISDNEKSLVQLFQQNPHPDSMAERLFVLEHTILTKTLGKSGAPVIHIGLEGVNRRRYFGTATNNLRSEALVPLHATKDDTSQNRHIIGSLNLGGATPSRFLPSDATDLLQDLADVFSLCLTRMTNT